MVFDLKTFFKKLFFKNSGTSAAAKISFLQLDTQVTCVGGSILQAAEAAGMALPFGCRQGMCGSCKQKLVAGAIKTEHYQDEALTEDERAAGYILCCIAQADGDVQLDIQ